MMLAKIKADGTSRIQEDKRAKERRKNIIVLITRYLADNGYAQSACSLETESGVSLKKWGVCDNVDLYYILQDYEEYHQIKFNKVPHLVKKIAGDDDPRFPALVKPPPAPVSRRKPPLGSSKAEPKEESKAGTRAANGKATPKSGGADVAGKRGAATPATKAEDSGLSLVQIARNIVVYVGGTGTREEGGKEGGEEGGEERRR